MHENKFLRGAPLVLAVALLWVACSDAPTEPEPRWVPPACAGQWGSEGAGAGQFDRPIDVAVAPDGNVYVADYFNERVQYFTPAGSFLGMWYLQTMGEGLFH